MNCTHVDGNLELTWLDEYQNLDFLEHIYEITGYLLISQVYIKNVLLPHLRIIRGRTLFNLNHQDYAILVIFNKIEFLGMPGLRGTNILDYV